MLGITDLWLFVMAGLLLNITPGPDMAYIMGRSAQLGVRAGAVAAIGISAGCWVHITAAALGLSAILATSAEAFLILKLVGAAYLVWVGVSLLRHAGAGSAANDDGAAATSLRAIFLQGFLTNALNPKVALFFLALMPQFISAGSTNKVGAFLLLGLSFVALGVVWCLVLAVGAAHLRGAFLRRPSMASILNKVAGVMFIALGLRLATVRQ
jgi:threonine/homoserine/homoserine lactone efflux protein